MRPLYSQPLRGAKLRNCGKKKGDKIKGKTEPTKGHLGSCRKAIFLRSKHPAAAPRFSLQILSRRKSGMRVFRCNRLPGFSLIIHPFSPPVNLTCEIQFKRYRLTAYSFCAIKFRDLKSKIQTEDLSGLNLSGLLDQKFA